MIHYWGNIIEAVFWIVIAACLTALLHCLFRYTALTRRDAPRG